MLQYAHKEALETGNIKAYDAFVAKSSIIGCFKDLRNLDIHEAMIGTGISISSSPVIVEKTEAVATTGWVPFYVETLDDLDNPKKRNTEVMIEATIRKPIEVTPDVIDEINREGRNDLMDAVRNGTPLFKVVECEGEKNLFHLCQMYVNDLERFVEYGVSEGFIS